MKRTILFLGAGFPAIYFLLIGLGSIIANNPIPTERPEMSGQVTAGIYSNRGQRYGLISYDQSSVFGPHICTVYGDPFSPTIDPTAAQFRQDWRDDPDDRTYHYKIIIPPDYPSDIVRIEIFDPDSINQPNNAGSAHTETVVHTNAAVNAGAPPTETLSCGSLWKNPCLIETGEDALGLDVEKVNPLWFVRVDENRGVGAAPGNGMCGEPSEYNVQYNTVTHFELFYIQQALDGGPQETPLAWYYGQSGDAVVERNGFLRDLSFSSYNHQTDLLWVSPGGRNGLDQPVSAPTGCGSPNGGDYDPVTCPGGTPVGEGNGFEINLDEDVPGIVVDENGNRILYLDVTSQSGASENAFDIWAGPDDHLATVSSNVNARDVSVLNDLSSHDASGIVITAVDAKMTSSNIYTRTNIPIGYIGPEYAGQSVYISLYDSDTNAQPPITFYFDTIAQEDWSLTFSNPPDPDPDGETGRCEIGSCNGQFVNPPYRIDIPTLSAACTDPDDPAQMMVCTPFYGGRLMANYHTGVTDSYLWSLELPEAPAGNPTAGCTAYPIALEQSVQTVTQADYENLIYPNFTYPGGDDRPLWSDFLDQPAVGSDPLTTGKTGQVFVFNAAPYTAGGFDWLKWNTYLTGLGSGDNILATSLSYPGNSHDYLDHSDLPNTPPPDWPNTYRGYAEAGDPSDKSLHLADFIARDTVSGGFSGMGVTDTLINHVDTGRALRLPLWDFAAGGGDVGNERYQTAGFGVFRVLGYSTDNWLLLQLVSLDDSCGQPPLDVDLSVYLPAIIKD